MQEALLVPVASAVPVLVDGAVPVFGSTEMAVVELATVPVSYPVPSAVSVVPLAEGDGVCVEPPSEPGGVATAPPQPDAARVRARRTGRIPPI